MRGSVDAGVRRFTRYAVAARASELWEKASISEASADVEF